MKTNPLQAHYARLADGTPGAEPCASCRIVETAICDADEHLVIDSDRGIQQCPSGRPASELYSISVLSLLRGTVPSRTTDYIASEPLARNGRMVGSIRVRLSGALIYWKLSPALFRAIFLAIVQILIVGSVAMAAAWIVFRRDYRISQRV